MNTTIYKIAPEPLWREAESRGRFEGAPIDLADGFIHFSTRDQAETTARLHFAGQDKLVLVAVDAGLLGDKLVYEPSRGGDLFPHLFAMLELSAVKWVRPLPLGEDGLHRFPDMEA
ncbi:uncharacterized protein (DUF952 family) [Hoeflea marina]|uniref:Uncharacterized protein (DUF952 family) n=1 Tax=Hoeflea marina TaxID=274592 RepID=A0A317PHP4_9HYPH|nr:DUF952 domain-containing protein [Hoeflea marina]PWV99873.1 uncharacterized protein (DUF952 family) [Hoeflea marina]